MKALKNDSSIYTGQIISAITDCYNKNTEPSNGELMKLYAFIGQNICEQGEKAFVVHLAQVLAEQLSQIKGFSPRNLRRMRDFYRTYENQSELMHKAQTLGWTQNAIINKFQMKKMPLSAIINSIGGSIFMNCIICRQEVDKFSLEHIIPDALGGCYTLNNIVCKSCNDQLGSQIDAPLVSHFLMQHKRAELNLVGKSDKIPMFINQKDETGTTRIEWDGYNHPKFMPLPIPKETSDGESISISITASKRSEAEEIIAKYMKRHHPNQKLENIEVSEYTHSIKRQITGELDFFRYQIGILKIAYEFAVSQLPEYYLDERAKEISSILQNADFEKMREMNLFCFSDSAIFTVPDYAHLVYLHSLKGSHGPLCCTVRLFDLFEVVVVLSEKGYAIKDDMIFLINDVLNKTSEVCGLSTIVKQLYDC